MTRKIAMSKSKMIMRTTFIDRACHWTVVICFFLVAVSGISFFFPTLQWLTQTFGTPQDCAQFRRREFRSPARPEQRPADRG